TARRGCRSPTRCGGSADATSGAGGARRHQLRWPPGALRRGARHVPAKRGASRFMIPFSYNVRSLAVRKTSTIAAVIGIALVVFVLAAVLMLRTGIRETMGSSGRADNAIVMRFGSQAELESGIDVAQVGLVAAKNEVARASSGQPLAVGEIMVVILLDKAGT